MVYGRHLEDGVITQPASPSSALLIPPVQLYNIRTHLPAARAAWGPDQDLRYKRYLKPRDRGHGIDRKPLSVSVSQPWEVP